MNILISGSGPAGLTAAYWLKRFGYRPTIVERAPSLVVGGYKIDVRGAALQVLKHMGIHDAVVAANTDMQGAELVDKQGNVVNRMTGLSFWNGCQFLLLFGEFRCTFGAAAILEFRQPLRSKAVAFKLLEFLHAATGPGDHWPSHDSTFWRHPHFHAPPSSH